MKMIAYTEGKSHQIVVDYVDGVLMSTELAEKWRAMKLAADHDRVVLVASSGFRTMSEQMKIYQERQDPAVRAEKGGASKPGFSRHQNGKAIDIRTGLSARAHAEGKSSPIHDWLVANASKFGFRSTVPSEPWHWEIE